MRREEPVAADVLLRRRHLPAQDEALRRVGIAGPEPLRSMGVGGRQAKLPVGVPLAENTAVGAPVVAPSRGRRGERSTGVARRM